jgi:hypothetical protein
MSHNSFGHLFRVTTWGESHGPAIGAIVDGCPPGLTLCEADIQPFLDKRRPGTSRFTTQRQEPDEVRILSGVFEGQTTGTPISLIIDNVDQRSKDYSEVAAAYRPGHADYAYDAKYGIRDYRGGGRSSARETAARVAVELIARLLAKPLPADTILNVNVPDRAWNDVAGFEVTRLGHRHRPQRLTHRWRDLLPVPPQCCGGMHGSREQHGAPRRVADLMDRRVGRQVAVFHTVEVFAGHGMAPREKRIGISTA